MPVKRIGVSNFANSYANVTASTTESGSGKRATAQRPSKKGCWFTEGVICSATAASAVALEKTTAVLSRLEYMLA